MRSRLDSHPLPVPVTGSPGLVPPGTLEKHLLHSAQSCGLGAIIVPTVDRQTEVGPAVPSVNGAFTGAGVWLHAQA